MDVRRMIYKLIIIIIILLSIFSNTIFQEGNPIPVFISIMKLEIGDELVESVSHKDSKWFIVKNNDDTEENTAKPYIDLKINEGYTFVEQVGAGLVFEKGGVLYTSETVLYTARYMMIKEAFYNHEFVTKTLELDVFTMETKMPTAIKIGDQITVESTLIYTGDNQITFESGIPLFRYLLLDESFEILNNTDYNLELSSKRIDQGHTFEDLKTFKIKKTGTYYIIVMSDIVDKTYEISNLEYLNGTFGLEFKGAQGLVNEAIKITIFE